MITKKRSFIVAVVLVLAIVIPLFFYNVNKSAALVPFGGLILNVTYCTCSFNLLLTVGPPVGGNYIFQPGVSVPFPYGQLYRPGPWILGAWVPGGACMMWVGKACAPLPSIGTILYAGTSL
jgi:hypothetical protein